MSVRLARKLNRLGYSVSHDGDKGWITVRKEKAASGKPLIRVT